MAATAIVADDRREETTNAQKRLNEQRVTVDADD
jgi:hypothetical protein